MNVVSKHNPLQHYQWGHHCEGWNLADEVSLSVKQERMPAGTSETRHYHLQAQQFFYIIKGVATFETAEGILEVKAGEGLQIMKGTKHRIYNNTAEDLEFILCSQPSTAADRINCE